MISAGECANCALSPRSSIRRAISNPRVLPRRKSDRWSGYPRRSHAIPKKSWLTAGLAIAVGGLVIAQFAAPSKHERAGAVGSPTARTMSAT